MTPIKATLLDDDSFRLLAIPFGGPIPSPVSKRGVDVDGEWFSERTDIKPDWLTARPVDWDHGKDAAGVMSPAAYAAIRSNAPVKGRVVIGQALAPVMEEDGWWVDIHLDRGARHLALVQRLAERAGQLYGSSETIDGLQAKASTGEILRWPYWRQTLTATPANHLSVMRPLKAALDDALGMDYPLTTATFWRDITSDLRDLAADLRRTSPGGDGAAKSGPDGTAVLDALRRYEEALARLSRTVSPGDRHGAQANTT